MRLFRSAALMMIAWMGLLAGCGSSVSGTMNDGRDDDGRPAGSVGVNFSNDAPREPKAPKYYDPSVPPPSDAVNP